MYAGTGNLHATPYRDRSRGRLPKLTRAHFEALASALRDARPNRVDPVEQHAAHEAWDMTVGKVAAVLADSNPAFDRAAFMTAVFNHEEE